MVNEDAARSGRDPVGEGRATAISRRELVPLLGAGALALHVTGCVEPELSSNGASPALADPLYLSSVRALASAIRAREVSSEEVVAACLARIDAVNSSLNAVVQLDAEGAISRARDADRALASGESWGPLHGVPMTIKDSLDTAGMISTGGTKGRASFVPETDATVVARLREAGAILMGKTNTPELTLSFETDNLVYGRTSNPHDLERSSGGSSGGAAAIVAAGGSPFDIGSDYGGSIRLPAHYNGITGIKPTAGRVPRTGHIYPFGGVQDDFQQIGPLARYVDDLVLLLPLIMGPDWVDPAIVDMHWSHPSEIDLRALDIAFHSDNGLATPTTETLEMVQTVARALEAEVRSVVERRPPGVEQVFDVGLPLYFWDGGAAANRLLQAAGTTEPSPTMATAPTPALNARELDAAIARLFDWRSRMSGIFEQHDAIVCPVNAGPALPHGFSADESTLTAFSYTFTYNMTGWPGAVVRAGTSPEGLPLGVQIVARPGREDVALALARFVEGTHGGYEAPAI